MFVLKNRDSEEETPFLPQESVIKWNKKRTAIKIQVRKILNFLNVLEASDVHVQCFLCGIIKKKQNFLWVMHRTPDPTAGISDIL